MKTLFPLLLAFGWLTAQVACPAATFTVTSTADDGPGTLRQAFLSANASSGASTILFNLPGSGVQTIYLTNALPAITNNVAINGYSQPGASANTLSSGDNAVILVRLDGSRQSGVTAAGLTFNSGSAGSSLRGLAIERCYRGVKINETSGITLAGNWIGMDVDGVARGMTYEGVYVYSFFSPGVNIMIGGTNPPDRNIISGNSYGVYFSGGSVSNSVVAGNYFGTDPTGTLPRGNVFGGVYVFTCPFITIGGPAAGAGNLLAAATGAGGTGVTVQNGANCLIQGNRIGTDISGQYDLGNSSDGVYVTSGTGEMILGNQIVNNRANGINLSTATGTLIQSNTIGTDPATASRPLGNASAGIRITGSTNHVGGLLAGQGNTIQFNGGDGIYVASATSIQDELSGNGLYDNGGLGIDLYLGGTGANLQQSYPLLTNATTAYGALTIQGSLSSSATTTFRVEFFATPLWDSTGQPEAKIFLGSTNVTTDGNGNVLFAAQLGTVPTSGYVLTATATDPSGNTSALSKSQSVTATGNDTPVLTLTVTHPTGGTNSISNLTWPSAAWLFQLEQTASLTPPVRWQTVTNNTTDANGTRSCQLVNPPTAPVRFFRLHKP